MVHFITLLVTVFILRTKPFHLSSWSFATLTIFFHWDFLQIHTPFGHIHLVCSFSHMLTYICHCSNGFYVWKDGYKATYSHSTRIRSAVHQCLSVALITKTFLLHLDFWLACICFHALSLKREDNECRRRSIGLCRLKVITWNGTNKWIRCANIGELLQHRRTCVCLVKRLFQIGTSPRLLSSRFSTFKVKLYVTNIWRIRWQHSSERDITFMTLN